MYSCSSRNSFTQSFLFLSFEAHGVNMEWVIVTLKSSSVMSHGNQMLQLLFCEASGEYQSSRALSGLTLYDWHCIILYLRPKIADLLIKRGSKIICVCSHLIENGQEIRLIPSCSLATQSLVFTVIAVKAFTPMLSSKIRPCKRRKREESHLSCGKFL